MGTPHKHAELIKAWADGAEIQVRWAGSQESWADVTSPTWSISCDYRIKPEPKPDLVRWGCVKPMKEESYWWRTHRHEQDNLKITFDGETYKLKRVEIIGD